MGASDCTEEFENILHTEKARKMAKKYLVGKVEGATPGNLFASSDGANGDASGVNEIEPTAMNTWVTVGFLVVAAGLAYQFYLRDRF